MFKIISEKLYREAFIMKDLFYAFKTNTFVSAIISILIGLALLLQPGSFTILACRIIAVLVLISGTAAIISYVRETQRVWRLQAMLILGIILVILGISMLARPSFFISLLPLVLGIIVLVHGLQDASYALNLKKLNDPYWWITLLIAAASILFAMIVIINPFAAASTVVMVIGAVLIYDGVSDLWVVGRMKSTVKRYYNDVADYITNMTENKQNGVVYTENAKEIDND